jgi:MFS family permease
MASGTQITDVQKSVFLACLIMFTEGFVCTMVFPYAAFWVKELRGTDESLGLMTGLIFTAFPVGSICTAKAWGATANRIGRRPCILISLTLGTLLATAIALCENFCVLVVLRFIQGLMNCTLPMLRTALRERVAALDADEVSAFAKLQAAFGASALSGPALGGLLYGVGVGTLNPWVAPQLVAIVLYVCALAAASLWLVETGKLAADASSAQVAGSKGHGLSQVNTFRFLLIMVAGHSFVFTGWEVGYPLFARDTKIGMSWSSQDIGLTFLVGSAGLMLYTLFGFKTIEKYISLDNIWLWSWVPSLIAMPLFPRMVTQLMDGGWSSASISIRVVNYGTQLLVSVLIGSHFLTLQLMLNRFIATRPDAASALPIANGWFVAMQALARAISPVQTGLIFTVSHDPRWHDSAMAFDSLALVGVTACVFSGFFFARATRAATVSLAMSKPLITPFVSPFLRSTSY